MTRHLLVCLVILFLMLLSRPAIRAEAPDPILADETMLKAVGLPTDGPGLVEFFRARGQTEVAPDKVAALIKQFDAPTLADREKACAELIAIGPPALPLLRRAAKDLDAADSSALARRCLQALDENSASLTAAAARVLAFRRPAGASATLVAFLPYAENDSVLEEVKTTLMTVSYRDGKPDAALVKALVDEQPLRRATAIEVLCHAGNAEPRATLRKLLNDPVPIVRFQAGLALSQANDAEAVSTMIGVLPDLPLPMAQQVEEYLYNLAGEQGPKPLQGKDDAGRAKQRDAWKAWWEANDGTQALAEFRKRTLTEADRVKGMKLIELLGDDDFETRQKASQEILARGASMLPLLRANGKNPDLEVRRRVHDCLESIEENKSTPLPLTAPRLLAVRKPAGAAEAMLAFLPAEDDTTQNEIQLALNALAYIDDKPDAALVKGLEDKIAARRAAAVVALSQSPPADVLPALRKLLKDPDATVRLQAALGLAESRERDAVAVLIGLIGELPEEQSEPAEDYMRRLAAERQPTMPVGDGDLRPKRQAAWDTWWKANGDKIELISRARTPLAQRFLNYTLLVQSNNGMVTELAPDGKTRWQITGLMSPFDAQVLPGDRVLIAEYNSRRITERNFKGDILWEKQLTTWPTGVQRLPNGHTFVTTRNQLLEFDRAGKEVFKYTRQFNDIITAHKLRTGEIVCLSVQGTCFRVSANGKEGKSFNMNQQVAVYGNEVLPNGNLLFAATYQNKVIEYDPDGKIVWEANVVQPLSVSRLPNGNTLVSLQQWPAKLIELDRHGKQVAESTVQTYVQRARKR